MAQQTDATAEVGKVGDAHLITVENSCDKAGWRAALNRAAEAEGFESRNQPKAPGFTYERVREFADSTLYVVWATDR